MATPRKLWSTTRGPEDPAIVEMYRKQHDSRVAAYRQVQHERAIGGNPGDYADVWVDNRDGHGWQLYERINLADYGTEG